LKAILSDIDIIKTSIEWRSDFMLKNFYGIMRFFYEIQMITFKIDGM